MYTKVKMLLAVDPSLTASGWAAFALEEEQPVAVGVIKPPGPGRSMEERLYSLQTSVVEVFEKLQLDEQDALVCEGPAPLVKNPSSSLKVERVRGVFEAVARTRGVRIPGRLNPRTVQTELLGMKGPQLARKEVKPWARETAFRLYGEAIEAMLPETSKSRVPQDIIDALLIGGLAVRRLNVAQKQSIPEAEVFLTKRTSAKGQRSPRWSEEDLRKLRSGNR